MTTPRNTRIYELISRLKIPSPEITEKLIPAIHGLPINSGIRLCLMMNILGITRTELVAHGGGDSGDLESILHEFSPPANPLNDYRYKHLSVVDELMRSFFWDYIESTAHGDWVNNAGGTGRITVEPIGFEHDEGIPHEEGRWPGLLAEGSWTLFDEDSSRADFKVGSVACDQLILDELANSTPYYDV